MFPVNDQANTLVVQADGELVAAGRGSPDGNNVDFAASSSRG
jgi:hypothetical protein